MPQRVFLFTRQLRPFRSSILRPCLGLPTAGLLGRVLTKYLDVLCSQRLRPSDIHHQPAWGKGRVRCIWPHWEPAKAHNRSPSQGTSTLAWHCTAVSLARRTHRYDAIWLPKRLSWHLNPPFSKLHSGIQCLWFYRRLALPSGVVLSATVYAMDSTGPMDAKPRPLL
ncbi:uncharacterized protein LY79DRAFT_131477 [Colletotrichum navitas]|uniref:Uncharacterized protein n=1 Tax=Colletotrichum navitas TaxID=681940 RepID=A0AAD8V517_9PEZI|nr:uncharacterized protein LY79DRAFT_131477 [Colletotrichum navitas]KAK1594527.1 hypothetical protein LY79DRAFT_131477 [Colletotrichum navitas]